MSKGKILIGILDADKYVNYKDHMQQVEHRLKPIFHGQLIKYSEYLDQAVISNEIKLKGIPFNNNKNGIAVYAIYSPGHLLDLLPKKYKFEMQNFLYKKFYNLCQQLTETTQNSNIATPAATHRKINDENVDTPEQIFNKVRHRLEGKE